MGDKNFYENILNGKGTIFPTKLKDEMIHLIYFYCLQMNAFIAVTKIQNWLYS